MGDTEKQDSWAVVVHPLEQNSFDRKGLLSLRRGEKIQILSQNSDIWWTGRKENGEEGLFPHSFVRLIAKNPWNESGLLDLYFQSKSVCIPPPHSEYSAYVTVLWDFTAIAKEEISLVAGSEVQVLGVNGGENDGFYHVKFEGKEGIVQSDFCSKISWKRDANEKTRICDDLNGGMLYQFRLARKKS